MARKKTAKRKASKRQAPHKLRKPTLNAKQKRFVEEFLVDLNATRAAIRAGYSPQSAGTDGPLLAKDPKIAAAIELAEAERSKRTAITQDLVLKELYSMLTSSPDHYEIGTHEGDTPLKLREGAPTDAMKNVASMKVTTLLSGNQKVEFRLWDKTKAAQLVMRHLGMLNDSLKIDMGEELRKLLDGAAQQCQDKLLELASRRKGK